MTQYQRYSGIAIGLHWLTAILVFSGFGLALYMTDLPFSPQKLALYSYHKWIGVTVFFLLVLRLAWRLGHPTPALPQYMPRWQVLASKGTQHLLYLLLFAIPLTGWLMSSAKGFPTVYFKIWQLPDLVGKNHDLAEALEEIHEILNWSMLSLVGLHSLAALKHHLVDKDHVLRSMLPWNSK